MIRPIDRRRFLQSIPALAVAPRLLAQSPLNASTGREVLRQIGRPRRRVPANAGRHP